MSSSTREEVVGVEVEQNQDAKWKLPRQTQPSYKLQRWANILLILIKTKMQMKNLTAYHLEFEREKKQRKKAEEQ